MKVIFFQLFVFLLLINSSFAGFVGNGTCVDRQNSNNQLRFVIGTQPVDNGHGHDQGHGIAYHEITQLAIDDVGSSEFGDMQSLKRFQMRSKGLMLYEVFFDQSYLVELPFCKSDIRHCLRYFSDFDARVISLDQEEALFRIYSCKINK